MTGHIKKHYDFQGTGDFSCASDSPEVEWAMGSQNLNGNSGQENLSHGFTQQNAKKKASDHMEMIW